MASGSYSADRYPVVVRSYIQFFFKRRLRLVLEELKFLVDNRRSLGLLEIGCADGVVLRAVACSFGGNFSEMTGNDISPDMIKRAVLLTEKGGGVNYFIRGERTIAQKVDIILEIGVANYADIDEELLYAKSLLRDDGVYLLSLAGKGSLHGYFWKGIGYGNFLSYREYEEKISRLFRIEKKIPVGVFIPLLWRVPSVARIIQVIVETLFKSITPNLFHEQVYILKNK